MASILKSALSNWEYQTTIMNEAEVSHSQITRYLLAAVKNGLMNYSEIKRMYRTIEKGVIYLNKYNKLIELFPSVLDLPDMKQSDQLLVDSKLLENVDDSR